MKLNSLKDLFEREVRELHHAKRDSLRMLSMLQRAASSRDLAILLDQEMSRAAAHADSLETLFVAHGTADCHPSRSVARLLADCYDLSRDEPATSALRDAALITLCRHLKHDLIAGLGCACAWARLLGDEHAVEVLQRCERDEMESDRQLGAIGDVINRHAVCGQTEEPWDATVEDTVLYCG